MISIITINFNNRNGLEATLKSVQNQTYQDFEHIVIDGNSTDGSKEVIEDYKDHLSYWVSEPDRGVYHAMNKGIAVAKGMYLQFLNSGDVLENPQVLVDVSKELTSNLEIYYGDLHFVNGENSKLQTYPDELTFSYFTKRSLGHPAAFIKKALFDRVFRYNEALKICSDWEFFINAICKYNATYKHLNFVISVFDTTGISSQETYKERIIEEQAKILERDFSFFLKELERKMQNERTLDTPPHSTLSYLMKKKIPRFILLKTLKALNFIYGKD